MTAQFTPGPWVAQSAKDFAPGRHDDERWTVNINGMPLIAVVEQYEGRAQANAHLIAAAPELLEALRELVKADDLRMGRKAVKLRLEIARSIIARAEGKA